MIEVHHLATREWGWMAAVGDWVEIGTVASWTEAVDAAERSEAEALATAPTLF